MLKITSNIILLQKSFRDSSFDYHEKTMYTNRYKHVLSGAPCYCMSDIIQNQIKRDR